MSQHRRGVPHTSYTVDGINELQPNQSASGYVPEPVTPPTSAHSSLSYTGQYHFPQGKLNNAQFSPNVTPRDNLGSQHNYFSIGSTSSMASPVDTQVYSTVNHQPSYLSTPHTPLTTNKGDSASIPSTPKAPVPLTMTSNGRQSGTSHIPGVVPLGHTRSYSYNLRDPQVGMSRMSLIPSTNNNSTGAQESERRPRAYSSGIVGSPIPLVGAPQTSNAGQPTLDISSHYPFPPPLSSPISPESVLMANSRFAQRHQYTNSFSSPFGDDKLNGNRNASGVISSPGLHRSLSATSTLSGAIGGNSVRGSFSHAPQEDNLEGDQNTALYGQSITTSTIGKRSSPPSSRLHRQRRSSSGASSSSVIDATMATSSNAGVAANATATASKNAAINVDILTADLSQIYSLCKDQRGCRYLQRKLSEGDPEIVRRVFAATHEHIVTLMKDPFGNYLCQKLFEHCTEEEITQLLLTAAPSLPAVATNQHGTRALQKLIDSVTTAEQVNILVGALRGQVVRLIRDLNGNHVIQKLLLGLDGKGSQFIYDAVCDSVVEIGSHRHGCCVLQRCLDYAQEENRNKLVAHIVAKSLILVCDPFGNYVCQYVIDLGIQQYTDLLVQQLLGKIALLSVQKFSSNVVEKCLRAASPELRRALVSEVMTPKTLHDLLLDNYGNYVIQTALESSSSMDASTKQQLAVSIQSALTTTRSPYGRRVMSKLKSW